MADFNEIRSVLLFSNPFFGTLLLKLEHIADSTINPPSACVSRRSIRYHPEFFEGLTLDEGVFVLAHEVLHMVYGHLPRIESFYRSGVGPDGKAFDARKFNQAADYPINAALVEMKVGKPMPKEKWNMCLDPQKYPSTMTPEEVYCLLPSDDEQGGGGGGDPLDGHDHETDAGSDKADAITPSDVMQAAQIHKMTRGELPGVIERLIGQLQKPEHSPWKRLRQFVAKSLAGYDHSTWKRLQRRMVVRGIGMPGRVASGAGTVGCVVDLSGSIDDEMVRFFGGHLAAIMDDARPEKIRIYWTDTRVRLVETAKNSTELRRLMASNKPGGGGTNMMAGVRAAEADKCDSVVVLTDGYCAFDACSKPIMWAITSTVTSTHGTTIHI